MNIFHLDTDPVIAAQLQADKHVVKMILESAQMLSTAHRILDGNEVRVLSKSNRRIKSWVLPSVELDTLLYKATHANHPSAVWARKSNGNYTWLYMHFKALCKEYTYRYGKTHLSETKLLKELSHTPSNIKAEGITEFALAMPDEYKCDDRVLSYRKYYKSKAKTIDMRWTKRDKPEWFNASISFQK